jgi:hypothetical protein
MNAYTYVTRCIHFKKDMFFKLVTEGQNKVTVFHTAPEPMDFK